jgi:hypothetical protein
MIHGFLLPAVWFVEGLDCCYLVSQRGAIERGRSVLRFERGGGKGENPSRGRADHVGGGLRWQRKNGKGEVCGLLGFGEMSAKVKQGLGAS